jgi:hypothetical protein
MKDGLNLSIRALLPCIVHGNGWGAPAQRDCLHRLTLNIEGSMTAGERQAASPRIAMAEKGGGTVRKGEVALFKELS